MSVLIQRAMYAGDPGLFSFVGKALKGVAKIGGKVLGGVVGAAKGLATGGITGAIGGALTGSGIVKIPKLPTTTNPVLMGISGPLGRSTGMPVGPGFSGGGVSIGGGLQIGPGGVGLGGGLQIGSPGAPATMVNGNGQVCRGHMNKTTYYSAARGGVVPAGSVCVSNRRMNPLNARAASRAMRRLTGLSKAMRSTERMIQKLARKAGGSRRSHSCGGKCRRK